MDGDGDDDHQEDIFVPLQLQNTAGLDAYWIREFVTDGALHPGGKNNPVVMPQGGNPMNDHDTPYLQAMAFPTLFPHGQGNVTKVDILCLISMQESNYHLLWYCVEVNGDLLYPFAGHRKWMYWAQNTSERHLLNQLKQVYQKKSPEHTGI